MPRSEHKRTPRVYAGWLYADTSLRVDTPEWFIWLTINKSFYFVDSSDERNRFTAVKEQRRSKIARDFWYAHRRSGGRLYRVYIGRVDELTSTRLADVARQLAEKAGVL